MKNNKYDQILQADEIIKEFQYRQVTTLTKIEKLCSKKDEKTRDAIVSSFENNADEMAHHGYYATYYHKHLQNDLKKYCAYLPMTQMLLCSHIIFYYHLNVKNLKDICLLALSNNALNYIV